MGGFQFPVGLSKRVQVETLSDANLVYHHDQLHILWRKLIEGYRFEWTFFEIYSLHSTIVREMGKREIAHIVPINELDFIVQI